jgi:hypothetical protein
MAGNGCEQSAEIKAKSKMNGCSITVGFGEKGFYSMLIIDGGNFHSPYQNRAISEPVGCAGAKSTSVSSLPDSAIAT